MQQRNFQKIYATGIATLMQQIHLYMFILQVLTLQLTLQQDCNNELHHIY